MSNAISPTSMMDFQPWFRLLNTLLAGKLECTVLRASQYRRLVQECSPSSRGKAPTCLIRWPRNFGRKKQGKQHEDRPDRRSFPPFDDNIKIGWGTERSYKIPANFRALNIAITAAKNSIDLHLMAGNFGELSLI